MADIADADEDGPEAPIHPEDGGNLLSQGGDIIAIALLPKFAKAAEILPDLGGCQAELQTEFFGGNAADPARHQVIQLAQITRQATDHIIGYLDTFHKQLSLI